MMQMTQFVKLCRDCQIVGLTLSEAVHALNDADVQVVFTAEVKRPDRPLQKMNYNDFLTALMKVRSCQSSIPANGNTTDSGLFSGRARSWPS